MSRNTRTGKIFEATILPALESSGYIVKVQQTIGTRPNGSRHIVDSIVSDTSGRRVLVSLKWQQTSGTAEQKVPYEVLCLADAVGSGEFELAYLVLGGEGWTLRKFFVEGGLDPYLNNCENVKIIRFEAFLTKVMKGEL